MNLQVILGMVLLILAFGKFINFTLREKYSNTEFFWSVFSRISTYFPVFDLLGKSPYSVKIRENADQKKSVFGHFWRSVTLRKSISKQLLAKNLHWKLRSKQELG